MTDRMDKPEHWTDFKLTDSPHWQSLQQVFQRERSLTLQERFESEDDRVSNFSYSAAGLTVDLSKNHLSKTVLTALIAMAEESQINSAIDDMLSGVEINNTEKRAVMHSALRNFTIAEKRHTNIGKQIETSFEKMQQLSDKIRSGLWLGFSGKPVDTVVNIGIGGSDLGPRMVCEALAPYRQANLNCLFVANIDPSDLTQTLSTLDPERTLFIVCSKTFGTLETLQNANAAKQWLLSNGMDTQAVDRHFVAATSNIEAATTFGLDPDNILPMWDWVGGRYSLWSAIGLSIAVAVGMKNFRALLDGAAEMDHHFHSSALEANLPVLLALLEIWYVNFWGFGSQAVLPYDHYLRLLPDYLQQLVMESNGKSVSREGEALGHATSPVVWGSAGTIGQHSFHQLLHQGTGVVPVDFILPLTSHNPVGDQHAQLVANCLAQSQALMIGKTEQAAFNDLQSKNIEAEQATFRSKHQHIAGNRPSTIIGMQKLTPATLGALLALYEHKVFCCSVLWNINAFDQWGVELGKQLSGTIHHELSGSKTSVEAAGDASTEYWVNQFIAAKE